MKDDAYKQAGVDIEAGDALVERIKTHVKNTDRPGWMGGIGGFGAFFDLNAVRDFKRPVLISATDGVGTKLKIAFHTGIHGTIGIDCVAMCVNDIIAHGADPLFFLDYFATGSLNVDTAENVIKGIAQGCKIAGCSLVGGETAEMPSMYEAGEYDLAGFTVGVVEKDDIIDGSRIKSGDVIFGLASNGLHSNGFSLVRKIIKDSPTSSYDRPEYFTGNQTLGEVILEPTRIYVKSILNALSIKDSKGQSAIRGIAHITGGGLPGNVNRIMPADHCAQIDVSKWRAAPIFGWLQKQSNLSAENMLRTFNCGIGMVVVCAPEYAEEIRQNLGRNETVYEIGRVAIKQGDQDVEFSNLEALCQS